MSRYHLPSPSAVRQRAGAEAILGCLTSLLILFLPSSGMRSGEETWRVVGGLELLDKASVSESEMCIIDTCQS